MLFSNRTRKLSHSWVPSIVVVIIIILQGPRGGNGKVLDIDERLPELVEQHPDKNWLVKFYAPWCYHCQQLEPAYNNVAERIYTEHGRLVVGRVDCTKYGRVCEKYGVDSYPTIIHINKDTTVKYRGDRGESSIISFAERLQGPDVNIVNDCDSLKEATNKHGTVVLSTIANPNTELRKLFESLARAHKSNYWFYQYIGTCKDFIHQEGLYLLKKNLNKPRRFPKFKDEPADKLEKTLVDWLNKESVPIYGQVSYRNIEKILKTGKLLVVAVLDEYKPARRFTASSEEFHKRVGKLAHKYAQYDDQLLFGYKSDLDLIEYFTITPVSAPNVILVKPDLSYHLMLDGSTNNTRNDYNTAEDIHEKLRDYNIRSLITAAKNDKLIFSGGNGYLRVILRHILGNFNKFMTMYRANPLLVSLIFGFPSLIVIFVIYTTCFYSGPEGSEEHEYSDDEEEEKEELDTYDEERGQILSDDHLKQD